MTQENRSFTNLATRVASNDSKYNRGIFSMLGAYARDVLAKIGLFQYTRMEILDIINKPQSPAVADQAIITNTSANKIVSQGTLGVVGTSESISANSSQFQKTGS